MRGYSTSEDDEDDSSSSSYSSLSNPSSQGIRDAEDEQSLSSLSGHAEDDKGHEDPLSTSNHMPCSADSEEETSCLSDLEENKRLHWRMDPEESLSDWTIVICLVGDYDKTEIKKTVHYHVHRNILSVGPKRCDYFARLFKNNKSNNSFKEYRSKTSRVQLHPLAAAAFPAFLDYLYSWNDQIDLSYKNAAALRFLGKYFGADRVSRKAELYWKNSMTTQECVLYYEHSKVFSDEDLAAAVIRKCATSVQRITGPTSPIFQASDDQLWLGILEQDKGAHSLHLSFLVASYCLAEGVRLDAETFQRMTTEDYLPSIRPDVALDLLKLERKWVPTRKNSSELTCLQNRCIDALASKWPTLDQYEKELASLGSVVVSRLLARSVKMAHRVVVESRRSDDGKKRKRPVS